jgi:hypothetical protein
VSSTSAVETLTFENFFDFFFPSAGCWGKGGQGHGLLVQLVVVLGDVMSEAAPGGCVHGAAVSVSGCESVSR